MIGYLLTYTLKIYSQNIESMTFENENLKMQEKQINKVGNFLLT